MSVAWGVDPNSAFHGRSVYVLTELLNPRARLRSLRALWAQTKDVLVCLPYGVESQTPSSPCCPLLLVAPLTYPRDYCLDCGGTGNPCWIRGDLASTGLDSV